MVPNSMSESRAWRLAVVPNSMSVANRLEERRDGSFRMLAEVPSGRRMWVIWRYDRESDEIPDVFGEVEDPPIFVITAY